jgi:hypothetical protein
MENWKKINGFDGYEVSDQGHVRSIPREIISSRGQKYRLPGKTLKPCNCGKGYLRVCLSKNGHISEVYIHKLVAEAFLPQDDTVTSGDRLIVNHIDGNKHNNIISNLEWVTYSENNQHAYDTGLKARGENFYNAKLTAEDVDEIRKGVGTVQNSNFYAKKFGVSRATIQDVVKHKTWKSLKS